MYQRHFGLKAEPFSIAPDPAFLYLSEAHNEALAHLMYGFTHGGFVLITGEVGTGKTTLLRNLLDRTPTNVDVAFILNPRLTVKELLETLCEELGVHFGKNPPDSIKQYIDGLNRHLLKTHQDDRSTVVVIDEAQNLSPAVLEQIRLLTNLETNDKKLMRIILLGQPELAVMLDRTELRQLAQRITARYHLTSLAKNDVLAYVNHRLVKAGGNPNIFSKQAINTLYRLSKGTPRLINIIADRAMLGAYVENSYQITASLIRQAAREVFGKRPNRYRRHFAIAATIALCSAIALGLAYLVPRLQEPVADSTVSSKSSPATLDNSAQVAQATTVAEDARKPAESKDAQLNTNNPDLASKRVSKTTAITRPTGSTYANRRQAYGAIFNLWGANYSLDSKIIPCNFAPSVGLQCLSRNGGWSEIDSLNSPVLLELWDEQSSPYYAALLKGDGETYTVQVGDQIILTTPKDMRDQWFGKYVLLWQTPPAYNGSLRQGDEHPSVRWLQQQLNELSTDSTPDIPNEFFSADIHRAVIEFQSREGLLADGIVGPLTWIRLSGRLNLPSPKLSD